ncbi:MAG: hypothetical protein CL581_03215 [Alteromonadaceae bacterium]|nr:hypothetical protein [Alteromonadaceae bacterium]MBH86588.1 hypothetical protein [Alteromonadaceae bacterium]|tara:strand:+ start:2127 stop:2456 length:330 start_codon:yes stop_codon:yes gene_type:complete
MQNQIDRKTNRKNDSLKLMPECGAQTARQPAPESCTRTACNAALLKICASRINKNSHCLTKWQRRIVNTMPFLKHRPGKSPFSLQGLNRRHLAEAEIRIKQGLAMIKPP